MNITRTVQISLQTQEAATYIQPWHKLQSSVSDFTWERNTVGWGKPSSSQKIHAHLNIFKSTSYLLNISWTSEINIHQ